MMPVQSNTGFSEETLDLLRSVCLSSLSTAGSWQDPTLLRHLKWTVPMVTAARGTATWPRQSARLPSRTF